MAARRLVREDHPLPVRVALRLYEFLASLGFAVVLITLLAIVLGVGTFVESAYGTEAVKFGVWNTWWFTLLNALLAVSIFCAAAIRFPWKRYQTGFVITHIGLLVLLAGCLMSQRGGIDAQIPLLEGERGGRAFEDSHSFRLAIGPATGGTSTPSAPSRVVDVGFRAGPFNWAEYPWDSPGADVPATAGNSRVRRPFVPWGLAPRDTGVLHDDDGVRLEVLDYYADSMAALAPSVTLRIGTDDMPGAGTGGVWQPVSLTWQPDPLQAQPSQLRHRATVGGGVIVFWKLGTVAEAEAFVAALPDPTLGYGERGQVVLVANGQVHRFLVDDRLDKPGETLPGSDLQVTVTDFQPQLSAVRLSVRRGGGAEEEMVLLADLPEVSRHAPRTGVHGTLWIERAVADASERMQGKARSRIDVVQAPDGDGGHRLFYRRWQAPEAVAGPLPADGRPVAAFAMPRATLQMRVDRFLPADTLEVATLPLPFDKDKPPSAKRRAAKVRVTVDGRRQEFWIAGLPIQPIDEPPGPAERRVVEGRGRSVTVMLVPDAVDIGFDVRLDNFERRLDPGTSQASHFTSVVDFVTRDGEKLTRRPVTITMNAPVDYSDPASGRSYRLFQESFMGPWLPGDPLYERFTSRPGRAGPKPDRLEASVLTVNYDPGRGVKYAGSSLIVIGIFTMFYMRAYFFAPRRRPPASLPA
ncbi:MAG: hypothetical protein ACKOCW_09725 [Planctomycetaceae bacterium]